MSEDPTINLDSQLPPTDSLSTLLKMHWNLAPNEPPPVSLSDRIIARRGGTMSGSDQGYSDDEDAFTLVHTHSTVNIHHNHNQSNNYVSRRNTRMEYGLNGLTRINHQHRYHNNTHHSNNNSNNHFRRGTSRMHKIDKRIKKILRRLSVLLMYVAPMVVGVLLGSIMYLLFIRTPYSQHQDNFLLSGNCEQTLQKWRRVSVLPGDWLVHQLFLIYWSQLIIDWKEFKAYDTLCCITARTIQRDLEVARTIEVFLSNQAGYNECGYKNYVTVHLSRDQLGRRLNESKFKFHISLDELSEALEHSLWLFAHNPHWGVSLMSGEELLVVVESANTSTFQQVDKLFSHNPYKPIQCLLFLSMYRTITHTWKYLAVISLNLAFLYFFYFVHQKRMGDLEEMFGIIHKISNILRREYIATKRFGGITKFHLVTHLREQIIPGKDRVGKEKLWMRAVEYLRCNESRVRSETRRVAGADVEVWKWIELEPSPTDSNELKERMSCWQGRALDDYPPGVDSKVAPPNGTPSQCFRVENVFKNETKILDYDTSYYIEYCILDQCVPHGGVVHIHVDRKSNIGCVYVKMESIQAAAGAYRALHGAWYKRRMLIVKYMSSGQYNDLFGNFNASKKLIYPPL